MKLKTKVHNFFEVEVYDVETEALKQKARAENIVLNQYFGFMDTGVDLGFGVIHNTCIGFGRGTGTPTRERTGLFNEIGSRAATLVGYKLEAPTSFVTKQIRLNADEFNGEVISEVGFISSMMLDGRFGGYVTHALLQDSEGNPITITKTDTDVIYIKGTFFVTITEGTGMGTGGIYSLDGSSFVRQWLLGLSSLGNIEEGGNRSAWGGALANRWPISDVSQAVRCDSAITQEVFDSNPTFYARTGIRTINPIYPDFEWDPVTKTLSGELISILDTAYMNQTFTQIGSFLGMITLPNHDILPPYPIVDKSIGIGDGTTKDFIIGCPIIMEDTESIYIDGVKKTKGTDYMIEYINNCVDMIENYASCQYSCFDDNIDFGDFKDRPAGGFLNDGRICPEPILLATRPAFGLSGNFCPEEILVTEERPVWIDFLQDEPCNRLRMVGNINRIPPPTYNVDLVIQYSDDDVTYTDVTNLVRHNVGSAPFYEGAWWTFDSATARYWKVWFADYEWLIPMDEDADLRYEQVWSANGTHYLNRFMLGYTSPGLHFIEAPAPGAVITADYSIDVLFKTVNNILRWQYAVQVDFGENS